MTDAKLYFDAGVSEQAGDLTNYILEFKPVGDLPFNIEFKITFSNVLYNFDYLFSCENLANDLGV